MADDICQEVRIEECDPNDILIRSIIVRVDTNIDNASMSVLDAECKESITVSIMVNGSGPVIYVGNVAKVVRRDGAWVLEDDE